MDEFDGEPRDLLPIIRDLSGSPSIKICVSSRPWQIFKDEFDRNPDQRLYLQDLTRNDIQAYVHRNFENDTNFKQAKEENAEYEEIVNEIVERAQGVWLWVALVTKSLLNGLTYGDSLKTLQMRLQQLPVDLEEFFRHMLDSVEQLYQTQMAETFLIALAANEELPLVVYSFLDDIREDPNFALSLNRPTSSKNADISTRSDAFNKISKREIQMQKRLDARTKGLLEITKKGTSPTWDNNRVDFLHRTVGEFLNSKDIKERFIESAGANFDPKVSLCHGFLAVIKSIPTLPEKEYLIHELLDYAYMSESETAVAQTEVIDELERVLCSAHPSRSGIKLNPMRQSLKLDRRLLLNSGSNSVLELCIQHCLSIYVKRRLELDDSLVSSRQWRRPLLSHAFFPADRTVRHHRIDPTTMIRLLLEHGVDPNAIDRDSTTWRKFVTDMIASPSKSKLELMDLLLFKGADAGAGSVLLETLTIFSDSPAKAYQIYMFDKLLEAGADPNAQYGDSTIWKRYLRYLWGCKGGLWTKNLWRNEFKQVKQLLLSGADPNATAEGVMVDQIIEATFGTHYATELLDIIRQARLRTDGGFLSRVWKVPWRRSVQPTNAEIDEN